MSNNKSTENKTDELANSNSTDVKSEQKQNKTQSLLNVFKSFLKIGFIGFGGGSALIPVIEKEVCADNKYIDEDEYSNFTVISNITPGALPVKLGALIGYEMAGKTGMFLAALLTSIPGVFITLGLLALLDILGESAIHIIEQAAIGISVFIIFLLVSYIIKIMKESKKAYFLSPAIVLMLSTVVLTFGKEIRTGLSRLGFDNAFVNSTPIFDISTINILLLLFFFIFFTDGRTSGKRMLIALLLASVYVLMFGSLHIINLGIGNTIYQILLLLVGIITLVLDSRQDIKGSNGKINWLLATKKSLPFLVGTLIIFAICFIINSENLLFFISNGFISTATSFGGGEAYLTVADGIFVEPGIISSTQFYSRVLPIANALPGSILVKILSGIGFLLGFETSMAFAFLMGTLGLMLATTASCVICIYIAEVYKSFSFLKIFRVLKLWVLPVICGLLISTILSMLNEVFHISSVNSLSMLPMFALIIGIYAMVYFLHKKFHLNDVFLILLSAVTSVVGVMVL